jgi:hypothetical protein
MPVPANMERSPEIQKMLDDIALRAFGRSATLAGAAGQCIRCGKPATEFRDEISRRDYVITRFCQTCQDEIYKERSGKYPHQSF